MKPHTTSTERTERRKLVFALPALWASSLAFAQKDPGTTRRHTWRFKVRRFNAATKTVQGSLIEQTEIQPGRGWIDAGTELEMQLDKIKHNPAELKPGAVVRVTEVLKDGEWHTASIDRASR
jgi:hypothetical protein